MESNNSPLTTDQLLRELKLGDLSSELDPDLEWSPEIERPSGNLSRLAFVKYLSLAFLSPFDVAETLLQIQSLPRPTDEQLMLDELAASGAADSSTPEDDFGDTDDDEDFATDENEFGESFHSRFDASRFQDSPSATPSLRRSMMATDAQGYVLSLNGPKYCLQPQRASVWSTVKALSKLPSEGLRSLWKGLTVQWIFETLRSMLQPRVEDSLNEYFDLFDPSLIPLVHQDFFLPNLCTRIVAQGFIGSLLSPLELIRTRMIAQSLDPLHRSYSTPIHCLLSLFRSSKNSVLGIIRSVYPNFGLTVLYHTFLATIQQSTPIIIHRVLRLSVTRNPFLYGLAFFSLSTLELLIRLPLETVRKRLQLQQAGRMSGGRYVLQEPLPASHIPSCVRLSDRFYWSATDCLWRIVSEESVGYELKERKRTKEGKLRRGLKDGWLGGVAQLYRGFWTRTKSNVIISMIAVLSKVEIFDEEDYLYF